MGSIIEKTCIEAGRLRIPCLVLAFVHIVIAAWFAGATPYRAEGRILYQRGAEAMDIGAPDERQHANYVQRLIDGKGPDVLRPGDPNLYESYQAHQPPAYYLLAALFGKAAGVDDVGSQEGLKLRYLNVLIGAITVVGVVFLCASILKSELGAWIGGAFVALLPMNAALSGAISNDPLLFALCTWSLVALTSCVESGWTWRRVIFVGVLTGLALLTKTTAVSILPVIVFAWWATRSEAAGVRPAAAAAVAILIGLAIVSPWWIRNLKTYGDPLAIGAFNQAFVGSPPATAFVEAVGGYSYWTQWVGWWTLRSGIGVFGYMDIFLADSVYAASIVYIVILFVSGILWATRSQSPDQRREFFLSAILLSIVTVLFIRFNMQYFQGQARYLFPAIGAIALFVAAGCLRFGRSAKPVGLFLALGLFALDIYILATLPQEFARRLA